MSVTNVANHNRDTSGPTFGFWRRSYAMVIKEFLQLRRDRRMLPSRASMRTNSTALRQLGSPTERPPMGSSTKPLMGKP